MLAYDYPLLGMFWTMLWLVIWIVWIVLLFRVIVDIFRSDDLGGFSKFLWLLFVIFLPYLGVFVYVIVRGQSMGRRDLQQAEARDQAMQEYIRSAAASGGGGGAADELTKLADLHQRGVLSDAEFAQQKAKLLA